MAFSPEALLQQIGALPSAGRYWVAFSGGMDSSVLLHTMALLRERLSAPIQAVHVDHGLSPLSGKWSQVCLARCAVLGIPCDELKIDASPERGEGPEAAARRARYEALASLLEPGELLLTAHHRGDQAETVLLQLLRGTGPHGLAGMPACRRFGRGWLARPLLPFQRESLHAYAQAQGIEWVDDPSNFDTALRRNFLRHEILPRLLTRYPAAEEVLARSAERFGEVATLLDELADEDLPSVQCGGGRASVAALKRLSPARRRNVLRRWLRGRGLPTPDAVHLNRIVDEVLEAGPDATPLVAWRGAEVRRYRDELHAMAPLPERPAGEVSWELGGPLVLPGGLGQLVARTERGRGVAMAALTGRAVTVRFRQGGERCRPAGRHETHALKKLFQEAAVPPWERQLFPLIHIDGVLASVPGLWTCQPFAAQRGEQGVCFEWLRFGIENRGQNHDN